jgi:NAD(P)-dependent dehydrogenase (short-subunit alcohol dehydrogenase family)
MAPAWSFDLSGRTALITGASSGLGRHFAEVLAASGARVVIVARRPAPLDELANAITARGGQALAVTMDTTDEPSVLAAYDAAEQHFGTIDTIIANAGTNLPGSSLGLSVEDFDTVVAINLRGTFLTVREGARRLIAAGSAERAHGRIVIISSITAQRAFAGVPAYSATKAAISQFGKVCARDWARKGVNVNVLTPGYMRTEMNAEMWESEFGRRQLASFPRNRIMDSDVLDPMLLFLCSDASAQVTGSEFIIDDGQSL